MPLLFGSLRKLLFSTATLGSALAFAGGYVDGGSYLVSHSFTGHITGNMVLAALAIADSQYQSLGILLLALSFFLAFTYVGQVLQVHVGNEKKGVSLLISLTVEAGLVALAPLAFLFHWQIATPPFIACLSAAMGLQNGAFSKAEGVSVHTTYMTGTVTTLVSLLARKSRSPSGKEAAASSSMLVISRLWSCFALGAISAGIIMPRFGAVGIWCVEAPLLLALVAEGSLCLPATNRSETSHVIPANRL